MSGDTYATFTDDLRAAVDWLASLGLRAESTRFGQNLRLLEGFVRARRERHAADFLRGREHELISAVPECSELVYVYKCLASTPSADLKKRLEKVLKGKVAEGDEGNIIARNTGFELVIGCELAHGGLIPDLSGNGDLAVALSTHRINIECKRLQSRDAFRKRIKEASDQLSDRAKEHAETTNVGVIAVAIGKLFHGGTKILHAASRAEAKRLLAQDAARFRHDAQVEMLANVNDEVDAVVYYLRAVVGLPDGGLLWARELVFDAIDRGSGIRGELRPMMVALEKVRDE